MSHFAKIEGGIVTQVIVAEQDFINSGAVGNAADWVQTSYNTHAGQHPEGRPLRKNYAGIGYSYDRQRDAFIPPKPFTSWVLNEATCFWDAPVALPTDGHQYMWNEATISWEQVSEIDNTTVIDTNVINIITPDSSNGTV